MTNEKMTNKYDLEERTAKFAENIIKFAKTIPVNLVTKVLIPQFVRASTSIGANYCEADDAESGKDFKHKIGICKKEARETKYWIRLIAIAEPNLREQATILWQETKELHLIFNKIVQTIRNKNKK